MSHRDGVSRQRAHENLLAGATGAVGQRLVPMLLEDGHEVVAMTRTAAKADGLRAAGALPVVADALDCDAVMGAVLGAEPEVIVHQMTALTGATDLKHFDRVFATTNRLRTEGTRHLLDAARKAGTRRLIAQSSRAGRSRAKAAREGQGRPAGSAAAPRPAGVAGGDPRAGDAGGRRQGRRGRRAALRRLLWAGTSLSTDGEMTELVRCRRLPVVGSGDGRWSFTDIDDAVGGVLPRWSRAARPGRMPSSTTSGGDGPLAPGPGGGARRAGAATCAGLAGPHRGGRGGGDDDDDVARRVQRARAAGAGLDAEVALVARGVSAGVVGRWRWRGRR